MVSLAERSERPRPAAGVLVLVAVVAIAGLVRDALRSVPWRDSVESHRIDDDFAELIRALPPDRDLGIVTDAPMEESVIYRHARYALAPRILHPGTDDPLVRYVVVAVKDPAAIEDLCRSHRLHRVASFNGDALVLLAREGS